MTHTAILAGQGQLPITLAASLTATGATPVYVTFDGSGHPPGSTALPARLEQLGELFAALKSADVSRVCFAGAMTRPKIDPSLLDTHALRLAACFPKGDDALLREVLAVFAEQGFDIASAVDIAPELTLTEQTIWGQTPSAAEEKDASQARALLDSLSPLDLGQGAVVAGGQVLGIETAQGTDSMLGYVAETRHALRRAKGVFVKQPKAGQDLRIDMPVIGPDTITAAGYAGVAGIVIEPGAVIVLEQERVKAGLEATGLFLAALPK